MEKKWNSLCLPCEDMIADRIVPFLDCDAHVPRLYYYVHATTQISLLCTEYVDR